MLVGLRIQVAQDEGILATAVGVAVLTGGGFGGIGSNSLRVRFTLGHMKLQVATLHRLQLADHLPVSKLDLRVVDLKTQKPYRMCRVLTRLKGLQVGNHSVSAPDRFTDALIEDLGFLEHPDRGQTEGVGLLVQPKKLLLELLPL